MKTTLTVLTVLLLAPLAAISAADAPEPDGKVKPNIVFIFADDWGWGDLSCHGHPFLKTPNLDRLAREGTDFQQFNVLSPVCSPSRVAAMTGRYPSRFGVNSVFGGKNPGPEMPDWLDGNAPTIARYLKAAGYHTAHFGKWHMGEGDPTMADYGIDESAVYHGPGPGTAGDGKEVSNLATAFIEKNKDKPFYLNVWLHESHTAHTPAKESLEKWKHLDDDQKRVYAAVITDGDNHVGKVLAALEKAGVAQNTIVIFSSDNGPESTGPDKGSPGKYGRYYSVGETGGLRGRKRSLFEGGVRVPFIVRWPGHIPAGVKNNTTVFTAVDLLPTLCAAAGVTPPAEAQGDGENLLPAFKGETVARTRPIFWLHKGANQEPDWWPRLAVRDGDWKLVMTDDVQRVELHHLTEDRAESTDVAKDHPEIVARLTKLALDWKATLPTGVDPSCVSKTRGNEPKKRAKKPEAQKPTATAPTKDRNLPFTRWDTNKDDFLTLDEYKAGQNGGENLEARFKKFDKNGDGNLTREEFAVPNAK
jgi:arylsulfatase A-like enzyme